MKKPPLKSRRPRKPGPLPAQPPPAAKAAASAVPAAAPRVTYLQRVAKGKRAQFYENVAIDQLFSVLTALTAEVSVAFDRIDTLERLLAAAGTLDAESIESYEPGSVAAAARAVKREALIERVFAVFDSYAASREP